MKKLFKAAASLAIGCAMLQASAFASIDASESSITAPSGETTTYGVTVSGVTDESTLLVLKSADEGANGTYTIPSNLAATDIVYINQITSSNSSASYSFAIGNRASEGDTLYFFAGGTNEAAAVYLGKLDLASDTPSFTLGDVNGDGEIDGKDALAVVNYFLKGTTFVDGEGNAIDSDAGDVNGDGEIDGKDALAIVNYFLKGTQF